MSKSYYNEIDPFAAAWLRELIKVGLIADGDVDERSITEVAPADLDGYTQCHFFAGIGVWSYALRQAGWPDDRPVWTGSCPCQPFSSAGQGKGFDDERHLWPTFYWLIQQCQPAIVIGEQVASKATDPWIDLVQADLEAMGYAFGCVPFPSAGVGAPHIRDRAYWVAHASSSGLQGLRRNGGKPQPERLAEAGGARGLANTNGYRCDKAGESITQAGGDGLERDSPIGRVGDSINSGRQPQPPGIREHGEGMESTGRQQERGIETGGDVSSPEPTTGPTNGFWRDADWLYCRDEKWRPVEPGTFPLVDGAAARVGRLRGYGNAINAQAAKVWIETVMEAVQC